MEKKLQLKKEAIKLVKFTKGKARAETVKNRLRCIQVKEGEKGVKKVQEKMKELGYPIENPQKLSSLELVPMALGDLIILTAKYVFNWTDKDIFEIGSMAPRSSFIIKLLMKTFISVKKAYKAAPMYWRKHFTEGSLQPYELNEEKRYAILRLRGWCHPVMLHFYSGYFAEVSRYVKKGGIKIKETEGKDNIGPYHEFIITWQQP